MSNQPEGCLRLNCIGGDSNLYQVMRLRLWRLASGEPGSIDEGVGSVVQRNWVRWDVDHKVQRVGVVFSVC